MSAVVAASAAPRRRRVAVGRIAAHIFLIGATLVWLVPIVFALYVALRPKEETDRLGYVSIAHKLTLSNFTDANLRLSHAGSLHPGVRSRVKRHSWVLSAKF